MKCQWSKATDVEIEYYRMQSCTSLDTISIPDVVKCVNNVNLIESHLITKDNQFGFKKKHSTDLCIFTVKSVIKYYNLYNSLTLSCFLDASKAYDRVNHWTLFKKLLKRSISVIVIRILMFWYSKQEICIKWGSETSICFTISNGVRQGGILSATLISFYMDDLSFILSESGIGCHIND